MGRRHSLFLLIMLGPAMARAENPQSAPHQADPVQKASKLESLIAAFEDQGAPLKYVIVSLPDPIDSRLAREFDLYLTSLIRGFEMHEYRIREMWLPWLEDLNRAKADPKSSPDKDLHDKVPGLLVFQPTTAEDPTVAALLVGESPVRGVHRKALQKALEIASCTEPPSGVASKLHLLGPSYSGSADSVGRVLRRFLDDFRISHRESGRRLQVSVLSGSATSPAVQGRIQPIEGVEYQAQSTSDDVKKHCMFQYLEELGISRVAMLVESSSYGQGFELEGVLLMLPFPMHISSIRSLYSADRAKARQQNGKNQVSSPSELAVDLADPQDVMRDGLPIFERDNTPATLALVLKRILGKLVRHKIEAVGIVATNVKDKLFLADEINRYAPNVRLFTFEGDDC